MWKPAEVVPQHKGRAVALFLGLIVAIFGYTGYLVYHAVEASKNPSTSYVLSNNAYKYPDIYVCLYDFYGCDEQELEEECMRSAQSTEGGISSAVFNPDMSDEQELKVDAFLTKERGWCVTFAASEIVFAEGKRDPEDYIKLDMFWYPGGGADASTTCIDEEGGWESHSESVFVSLRDSDTGIYSAGIQVPYSCRTSASNSHTFNYMGVGLTKENKIRSSNTAAYKAVATSSALQKDKMDASITGIASPYAWLSMELAQEENSLEEITEIDPLKIAEILGNVGGFWDLLLLLWPLFFVAAARQEPHLKVRNLKKSITRGSERVVGLSQPVLLSASLRRRNELVRRGMQPPTADEANTDSTWENGDASARHQNPQSEHDYRHPRISGDVSSTRSPYFSPASREGVTRHFLSPQGSRLKSSPESPRQSRAGNELQDARDPPSQSPMAPQRPLPAAPPTADLSGSQASAVFTV